MKALLIILVVVAIVVLLLYLFQHRMIYFPRGYHAYPRVPDHLAVVPLDSRTESGSQRSYYAWAEDQTTPPESIWLLFGGNASQALAWLPFVSNYPDRKAGFLLIEYPGYGDSEGQPSSESILEATESAVRTFQHRSDSLQECEINVFGHSIGAAAALQYAAKHPVSRAVLVAPFTSLGDMARHSVGPFFCKLLRDDFDNRARLAESLRRNPSMDVLLVHGTMDSIIPVEMGRELGAMAPDRIRYVEVPYGDHNRLISEQEALFYSFMMQVKEIQATSDTIKGR